MELREYLFRHRITALEFAAQIDYNYSYLVQITTGNRKPGKKMQKVIERETGGLVKAEDWETEKLNQKPYNRTTQP